MTAAEALDRPDSGSHKTVRRASIGAALGTYIEGYDLSVYGYTAIYIAPLFFPSDDRTLSLLLSLAVFALAYLARPFGGIVFGHLGDRVGRRAALMTSILCMGVATTAIAVLPTYGALGIGAPVILLGARLVQGFSVGGEVAGATTYVSEIAPPNARARLGSLNPLGSSLGFASAAALIAVLTTVLSSDQMADWGWRIPFLIALPLTAVSLWVRARVLIADEVSSDTTARPDRPLAILLKNHAGPLACVVAIAVAVNATAYIGLTYLSIHLINVLGYPARSAFWVVTASVAVSALAMLGTGIIGDRVGLKRLMVIGLIGYAVLALPAFLLLEYGNLALVTVGVLLVLLNGSFLQVSAYSLLPLFFPREVRFSGMGLGYSLGAVIAGGTAPLVARWLVDVTGSHFAPALLIVAVCAIAGVALYVGKGFVRDGVGTSGEPSPMRADARPTTNRKE